MKRLALVALAALPVLAIGCGPGFDPASLIERPRLVGARVEVARDTTLAWPSPGDDVSVRWWVAQPGADAPVSIAVIGCPLLPALRGNPVCFGPPTFVAPPTTPSTDEPVSTFAVGPELLGSDFLLLGAICAGGGVPSIDAMAGTASCAGDEEARAELFVFSFPVVAEGDANNRHPSFDEAGFLFAGSAWAPPPSALPLEGCGALAADASTPRVLVPEMGEPPASAIALAVPTDARELYISTPMGGEPTEQREPLQISHYASAGSLERFFDVVEGDDVATQPQGLDWTAPARDDVPEGGLLVRFAFVARDLRGGFARAERVACVVR